MRPYEESSLSGAGKSPSALSVSRLNNAADRLHDLVQHLGDSLGSSLEYANRLGVDHQNPNNEKTTAEQPGGAVQQTIEQRLHDAEGMLCSLLDRARRLEQHLMDLVG